MGREKGQERREIHDRLDDVIVKRGERARVRANSHRMRALFREIRRDRQTRDDSIVIYCTEIAMDPNKPAKRSR
jgi:hypothetical protein